MINKVSVGSVELWANWFFGRLAAACEEAIGVIRKIVQQLPEQGELSDVAFQYVHIMQHISKLILLKGAHYAPQERCYDYRITSERGRHH